MKNRLIIKYQQNMLIYLIYLFFNFKLKHFGLAIIVFGLII